VGSRARHIHREGRLLSWRLWHCSLRSRHGGGSGGFRDGGTPGVELGLKLVQARERKCRVAVSGSYSRGTDDLLHFDGVVRFGGGECDGGR